MLLDVNIVMGNKFIVWEERYCSIQPLHTKWENFIKTWKLFLSDVLYIKRYIKEVCFIYILYIFYKIYIF